MDTPLEGGDYASPFSVLSSTFNASTLKIRNALESPGQKRDVMVSALGNALLLLVLAALFLVYRIMEHFVRPIVWALLVGAGLFPLKKALKAHLKDWLGTTNDSLLVVSLLRVPGSLSSALLSWLLRNWLSLLAVACSIGFGLMVERLYNAAHQVLIWTPEAVDGVRVALQLWRELTAASVKPVVFWSVLLGVPLFVLLRRHEVALTVLSTLVWLLVVVWVFPTAYAVFPALTAVTLVCVVAFVAMGLKEVAPVPTPDKKKQDIDKGASSGRGKRARRFESRDLHRTSSSMVLFLGVGCLCVVFLQYLPLAVVLTLVLSQLNPLWNYLAAHISVPESPAWAIVFPPPVRFVAGRIARGDEAVRASLKGHADSIATLLTLCVFILGAATVFVWATVSIYQEVQEIGHNATRAWLSGATSEMMPDAVNEMVERLVTEGRGWLEGRLMINASSLVQSVKLFNFTSSVSSNGFVVPTNLTSALPDWGTMVSVFESVRESGKQVLSFAVYYFYSVVLGMTGLLLSCLIFFTLLFYLLAASDDEYRPFEWIENSTRMLDEDLDKPLISAVDNVFHTTIMVACFHGLFTWISLTLLGARWVAISTALSVIFAALPFVAPFWCALPSAIELFYSRSNAGPSLALMSSQLTIYLFVDPIIYSETGNHPYMTALAVVGGLYFLGAEGIVLGPLVLVVAKQLFSYLKPQKTRKPEMQDYTPVRGKKL
jgi:predicted PurR-regulated permease PerM